MPLAEFQTVRIKALLREDHAYDPLGDNDRSPRVGDMGIIVDVMLQAAGQSKYTVECVRPDGTCVWLADFQEQELEAVEAKVQRPETGAETHSEREPDPARSHESDPTADAPRGPHWWVYPVSVMAVLLFLAVAVTAGATVFYRWPPHSAGGAGLRTATVMGLFTAVGGFLAGERSGELLISATIVAITFFALGALAWFVLA